MGSRSKWEDMIEKVVGKSTVYTKTNPDKTKYVEVSGPSYVPADKKSTADTIRETNRKTKEEIDKY